MRIAVLGAGGFIGSHLVPALLDRLDCEIDAVDVRWGKLECKDARLRTITARVEDPGLVEAITGRCELVVSLTALCNPALYNTRPLEVIDASYSHLVPLVRSCAERGVRLIHCSTSEVYGRIALHPSGHRTLAMNEDESALCLGPVARERWTYACAKQLLERTIWAYGEHHGLAFTIVRLFNVIGPRMDFLPGIDGEGIPRVLASFMHALLTGGELRLVGGGQQRRTFMAASDLVEALLRMIERPQACRNQIVNLGNPSNDVSIAELAEQLRAVHARLAPAAPPARLRHVTAEQLYGPGYDDSEERIPDIDKARRLLDWEPEHSLEQMLPGIVADYIMRYGPRLMHEGATLRARQTGSP
jgi:UDP-apiose/xylose synthase